MRKILVLFKREYLAAVKTKSFIISLVLVPIMMGGSLLTFWIIEKNKDTTDKKFVVIDHSGLVEGILLDAASNRNASEIYDRESGEKVHPAYILEFQDSDPENPTAQRIALSDRIRSKDLYAFVEIGPGILHPRDTLQENYMRYYSENSFMDDIRYWFSNVINNYLRQLRIGELQLEPEITEELFAWNNMEAMGLAGVDKKTGETVDAQESNELQSFLVPYIVVILFFMLTMMSAVPLLSAVMEEKAEKIAEVLLGTITPFQFMAGKVLGGIGVGLTVAAIYIIAAVATITRLGFEEMIPVEILPWFFVYLFLYIVMVGSGMAALGATCSDNKDAQSLQFPAMFPVIFPMFIVVALIQNPTGAFSTTLAFIPPFTPSVMMIRLATPVTIPAWQPILGLLLVILFTLFTVWIGARIFRTAILIQGQKPTIGNLLKYAFRS